jgi:hypothetical protein
VTDSLYICHIAGNAAPVSKTVRYGTVTGIPGEPGKCWITSNLGSDNQANAVNDATEPSAGWYWQFNRQQGYKHTGMTVTPGWMGTPVIEDSDWTQENDPCTIELGAGWRLPTSTEWTNVDAGGSWANWNGPWNSALKMHAAGCIGYLSGSLTDRGTNGFYWGGTQGSEDIGWCIFFDSSMADLWLYEKGMGLSVRCIEP